MLARGLPASLQFTGVEEAETALYRAGLAAGSMPAADGLRSLYEAAASRQRLSPGLRRSSEQPVRGTP